MKNLINELYHSEINIEFSFFWDEGFKFKIGDPINGFKDEITDQNLDNCLNWLIKRVMELYPNSYFTENFFKKDEFTRSTAYVMKYLSENHNPHTKIIIDQNTAEMVEGIKTHINSSFIKD